MNTATLRRQRSGNHAQWTAAVFLPDYGMNSLQLHGWLPSLGDITLLAAPPQATLDSLLDRDADPHGWRTFQFGGAWLVPFANRVWGQSSNGSFTVPWDRGELRLPEYTSGTGYALHGLMLATPFTDVRISGNEDEATLTAQAMVGDFGGRWPSSCKMHFRARISSVWLDLEMRAENVGDSPLPIAIGWHPYFLMPGSQRAQWRLRLPATHRLEVNNYKGMRPTGEKLPVHDTPWDFSSAQGRLLGNGSYDECYLEGLVGPGPGLDPTPRDIHLCDGSSGCDLLLRLHSPEINAVQLFSSPTDQSIAIEPQFNLPDPFNPVWQGASGMVSLAPGQSTAYRVSLSLRHAAASTEVQPPEGAL